MSTSEVFCASKYLNYKPTPVLKDTESFLCFVVDLMYETRDLRSYVSSRHSGSIEISTNSGGQVRRVVVQSAHDAIVITFSVQGSSDEVLPDPLLYHCNSSQSDSAFAKMYLGKAYHWLRFGNTAPPVINLTND